MLAGMTSKEVTEWQLFEQMEPFGERGADLRAGVIAAVLCNLLESGKDVKARQPADFFPALREATPEPVVDSRAALRALAESLGAKVVRRGDD